VDVFVLRELKMINEKLIQQQGSLKFVAQCPIKEIVRMERTYSELKDCYKCKYCNGTKDGTFVLCCCNFLNQQNICPKCGSKLIERIGIYGKFFGCAKYPYCKFKKELINNK